MGGRGGGGALWQGNCVTWEGRQCVVPENTYTHPFSVIENSCGRGSLESLNFKGKHEAKMEFLEGGEALS